MSLSKRLVRNEDGALMIVGIFMMLVVVSMLYILIGTAKTLLAREGMQDAADASAFSAAVFMARGMNLIALINLLMALLLALLVAVRLTQTFFAMSAAALYSVSWYFGISAPAATACKQASDSLGKVYKNFKDPVLQALEVMHQVQEATSVAMPFVAAGAGIYEVAAHHPPAVGAFALPAPQSLPIEADKFEVLCGKATERATTGTVDVFVGGFALLLDKAPPPLVNSALAPVRKAAETVGESMSQFLCGDGSQSPPKASFTVENSYPKYTPLTACEEDPHGARCQRAEFDLRKASPDDEGLCQVGADCEWDGLYESQARRARKDCDPSGGGKVKDFDWQHVTIEAIFRFSGGTWREVSQEVVESELVKDAPWSPCGRFGTLNNEEYNLSSGSRHRDFPEPVCTDKNIRTPQKHRPREGDEERIPFKAALRIFGCTIEEEDNSVTAAEKDDALGGEDNEKRSSHKMQEDVELGSETFQVRALSFGPEVGPGSAMDGVRVSLFGQQEKETSELLGDLNTINRFGFAQAEYYFDHNGSTPKEDWLWEMNWKARLKRVRLPSKEEQDKEEERQDKNQSATQDKLARFGIPDQQSTAEQACSKVSKQCPSSDKFDLFASLVIH